MALHTVRQHPDFDLSMELALMLSPSPLPVATLSDDLGITARPSMIFHLLDDLRREKGIQTVVEGANGSAQVHVHLRSWAECERRANKYFSKVHASE